LKLKKDIRFCSLLIENLNPGSNINDINSEFNVALLKSVKEVGIVEPLLVINLPTGYHIKVGNSRYLMAKILEIKTVPVILVTLEKHLGRVHIPSGRIVNSIEDEFEYSICWVERENYVAMKCTHFHIGDKVVK